MIYYRVAFRANPTTKTFDKASEQIAQIEQPAVAWRWRSTILTSPHALFTLLRAYNTLPQDHIRVFFASSEEGMDEMLSRLNQGQVSTSLTAAQFMESKRINAQDVRRLELELSTEPEHDQPYSFALPVSFHERLAWTRLLCRVERGELDL